MIITRVTEAAQGSYGRATHPRFWSAPDSWRVRVEELFEVGGKIPTRSRDTSQGTRFHAGLGSAGRDRSTVAKCGARVAGSTGSELCPGSHPSPSPPLFFFKRSAPPTSWVSHVGTSLRSTISHPAAMHAAALHPKSPSPARFPFTKKGQGRTALGYLALDRVHLDPTPPHLPASMPGPPGPLIELPCKLQPHRPHNCRLPVG